MNAKQISKRNPNERKDSKEKILGKQWGSHQAWSQKQTKPLPKQLHLQVVKNRLVELLNSTNFIFQPELMSWAFPPNAILAATYAKGYPVASTPTAVAVPFHCCRLSSTPQPWMLMHYSATTGRSPPRCGSLEADPNGLGKNNRTQTEDGSQRHAGKGRLE